MNRTPEDIKYIRNLGLNLDDDKEPAPENIPVPTQAQVSASTLHEGQEWKNDGLCQQRMSNVHNCGASIRDVPLAVLKKKSFFEMLWDVFLPCEYFEKICWLTDKKLHKNGARGLKIGGFIRWLRLWFYMATLCFLRRSYWSSKPLAFNNGAPCRFHQYVSKKALRQYPSQSGYHK